MAIAAAEAARAPKQADGAVSGKSAKKSIAGAFQAGKDARAAEGGAKRRRLASGAARRSLFAGNVLAMMTRQKPAPAEPASPSPELTEADLKATEQYIRALAIVDRHANYSAASGFIPLPLVNIAAITAVLVRMVRELSRLYGVPFERNRAYSLVIGLIGGVMPARLATVVGSTVGAFVPGINLVGLAVSSVSRIGLCPPDWPDADRAARARGGARARAARLAGRAALAQHLAAPSGYRRPGEPLRVDAQYPRRLAQALKPPFATSSI